MISEDPGTFPVNILHALKSRFVALDPDVSVFLRPIRKGDPIQCWGFTAALWVPDNSSWEMLGTNSVLGATINAYTIGVQCFNQDMDPERGLLVAGSMAGMARRILTQDPALRDTLGSLQSSELGYTERARRFFVQGQRFLSNEIEGTFMHLANLEFVVETEISA